jgi:hypothetical protein
MDEDNLDNLGQQSGGFNNPENVVQVVQVAFFSLCAI